MAVVVTYWQLCADEAEFLDFLQTTGHVVAFRSDWVESKDELSAATIESFIERNNPPQLLFGLDKQIRESDVETHEFEGKLCFGLPHMKSSVFGYRRGRLCNGKLAQSSLSAYLDYPDETASKLIEKDKEFLKWAKSVTAWLRKATPERLDCNGHQYRATIRVKDAVNRGELAIAQY